MGSEFQAATVLGGLEGFESYLPVIRMIGDNPGIARAIAGNPAQLAQTLSNLGVSIDPAQITEITTLIHNPKVTGLLEKVGYLTPEQITGLQSVLPAPGNSSSNEAVVPPSSELPQPNEQSSGILATMLNGASSVWATIKNNPMIMSLALPLIPLAGGMVIPAAIAAVGVLAFDYFANDGKIIGSVMNMVGLGEKTPAEDTAIEVITPAERVTAARMQAIEAHEAGKAGREARLANAAMVNANQLLAAPTMHPAAKMHEVGVAMQMANRLLGGLGSLSKDSK